MKPLHAKWIMELYNEFTSEKVKEVVISGTLWRASGILDAVAMGLTNVPEAGHPDVNERCDESDSEAEYILDDMHDERTLIYVLLLLFVERVFLNCWNRYCLHSINSRNTLEKMKENLTLAKINPRELCSQAAIGKNKSTPQIQLFLQSRNYVHTTIYTRNHLTCGSFFAISKLCTHDNLYT